MLVEVDEDEMPVEEAGLVTLVPMVTILLVWVLTASLLGEVVIPNWGRGIPPPPPPLSRDFLLFSDFAITDGDFWVPLFCFTFVSVDGTEVGFRGKVDV